MPHGCDSVSHDIYQLHMTIFWICVIIGVAVFSVMFYALIHHRKSKGAKAANFHEHLWVEIIWTIIPTLILIGMAIPATRVLMHMDDSAEADINIKITGYQWKWKYDYLDEGFGVFSNLASTHAQIHNQEPKGEWYLLEVDEPLVVPVHKKIRFLITANDVIHSWWVPELGVKQDGFLALSTKLGLVLIKKDLSWPMHRIVGCIMAICLWLSKQFLKRLSGLHCRKDRWWQAQRCCLSSTKTSD